ncbi:MAG: hypothetical protein HC783_08920 [Rhodobacteraceae bacterium]|nr:hypothetical protein [Paracoccaceae bacterium]
MLDSLLYFLSENWGNAASVLGAVLTVFYARSAKKAADAAQIAATNAKARMVAIDWVVHFSEIVSQIDDLLIRISHETDRKRASVDLAKLRSKVAVCLNWDSPIADENIRKKILRSSTQISSIAVQLDNNQANPANSVQIPKINKTLSDQRELYAIALDLAKNNATESGHVK